MDLSTADILQNLGWDALSPMQVAMGEACDKKADVVLLSPTGTGKTVAYLLPLVRRVKAGQDSLQAVVIVPSRELAQQSAATLQGMKTGLRALCLHGGRPAMEEHRKIKDVKPHVVFATPGRLNDHLDKKNLDCLTVNTFVIDEFDKSLEAGFEDEMRRIAVQMPRYAVKWLLSATDSDEICSIVRPEGMIRLDYRTDNDSSERSRVILVQSPQKDKLETLARLLTSMKGHPAIVFAAHRESVDRIGTYLKKCGFIAETYHGGMEQEQRERSLYKYRSGGSSLLISTDLAARGLDIPETEFIVHYHLPLDEAAFIHRNGRATRWQSQGVVYVILGPDEPVPAYIAPSVQKEDVSQVDIRPYLPKWTTIYIGRGKKEKISKADIVGFLCKKGGLECDEIGRIEVGNHHAYAAVARHKVKPLLRMVKGEKIKGMKTIFEEMK